MDRQERNLPFTIQCDTQQGSIRAYFGEYFDSIDCDLVGLFLSFPFLLILSPDSFLPFSRYLTRFSSNCNISSLQTCLITHNLLSWSIEFRDCVVSSYQTRLFASNHINASHRKGIYVLRTHGSQLFLLFFVEQVNHKIYTYTIEIRQGKYNISDSGLPRQISDSPILRASATNISSSHSHLCKEN